MILDGRELSKSIKENIKKDVEMLPKKPRIDFLYFDDDKSSEVYFTRAKKQAESVGMIGSLHNLPVNTTEEDFLTLIEYLNKEKETSGIMIQMPLPKHISKKKVYETISVEKDADAISHINLGRIFMGENDLAPCTAKSAMALIEKSGINIEGANAVVIGRSEIVGKPLAHLLLQKSATVTIAHSKTKNLKEICKNADILCVSIGKSEFITGDYIKEGAVVIDIGINVMEDGSLKGDVNFEEASKIASSITPVPNGVGSVTVAMLLSNVLYLHNKYNNK
ncbi:bifunctional 5,10-methylenetetrahydrofolate dehydrogenase/5,10-methenyltetrahydrofolate cyclohydrolase [Brachyspira innocens]|uniref:Bifunctional protein FolD n=1 Tax=Brachyspira innocens TaxID=13264 RepID=A0ABT8YVG4_9SPIR|nr:bifunctional 5,10-methylenetetrahydrofolate dehydrogenase/5,10-methenyltetrahydrofolate cyclohydrolase [Brachyspira innocens]MDO6993850.1 bifunctional 5,10-methylenetetrahydrofolate dehydrogenase/5,10-methenyltetrahydrofolate cyclohydrolase [Brachyspira innocens]MDO7019828.1 bifunctional 5,10-methylenetetrahydrofolate dehydrogenase/5,10-methenyltetrahydrofolate cyclohydrolase [Brachyspira innocens]